MYFRFSKLVFTIFILVNIIQGFEGQVYNLVTGTNHSSDVSHVEFSEEGATVTASQIQYETVSASSLQVVKDRVITGTKVSLEEEKLNVLSNVNEMFFTVEVNTKENETVVALCLNPKEAAVSHSVCHLNIEEALLALLVFAILNWILVCLWHRKGSDKERRGHPRTYRITAGKELVITPDTSFRVVERSYSHESDDNDNGGNKDTNGHCHSREDHEDPENGPKEIVLRLPQDEGDDAQLIRKALDLPGPKFLPAAPESPKKVLEEVVSQ